MRILDGEALYSPSDLVAFLGCEHRSVLDLRRLAGWEQQPAPPDAAAALVRRYGDLHERAHLARLLQAGHDVVTIERNASLPEQAAATRRAMADGAEIIYQGALLRPPFAGYADFLLRVPGASALGDHHYELVDTKLAGSNRAKFMVQLGIYADLLAEEQGRLPEHLHVELGRSRRDRAGGNTATRDTRRTTDFIHYVSAARARFLQFVQAPPPTRPVPVSACGQCGWREHCEAQWEAADHLSRVANIRSDQVAKLEGAGITTLQDLALTSVDTVKGIGKETLTRLKRQAALQHQPFDAAGRRRIELRAAEPGADGKPRGFALLPEPDAGDMYFDMEGFPHEPGGLEYLFGVGFFEKGERSRWTFRAFWGHDRQGEKLAFEQFMDFVEERLRQFPRAHIYHYAAYEKTALERLASQHDTRAALLDRLLREGRLVDMYRVVGSALLLAVPSYSIKKVEAYYRGQRAGAVVSAGESIVQYEAFRLATDALERAELLRQIEDYNHDDVQSTRQLHDWLEGLRPADHPRWTPPANADEPGAVESERMRREQAAKSELAAWAARQPETDRPEADRLAALLGQLLGFYRRAKLPYWWRHFDRLDKTPEELKDDADCLAGLVRQGDATAEKRSLRYSYQVPEQECKLYSGSSVACMNDGLPVSNFEYDEKAGLASFTRSRSANAPPDRLTLELNDNIDTGPKLDAIYRYVAQLCDGTGPPMDAVRRLLSRRLPALHSVKPGDPLAPDASVAAVTQAVLRMEHSHLVIQGPPGTGKTTTAAAVIVELLARGNTVGITANSHAAINNLLNRAWSRTQQAGLALKAAAVRRDDSLLPGIATLDARDLDARATPLAGGTAWLFCRPAQAGRWDYLFIDEASQVSLADVVAAGGAARNIVLLGDQLQLAQPVEGSHPGDSGLSALDYLMQGHATVPPEQGIFLDRSHRMHPDVCGPVSDGVYEGRLTAADACSRQQLRLGAGADAALRPSGVYWVPVAHTHCRQRSEPEARRIAELYDSLLQQSWVDRDGTTARLTSQDILIVAPYNAQVRLLRDTLGSHARVGTVDKFQGQEAAAAIYSMTTSDAESMPRSFDFLFSRNRLNVGVSRAKCLALIVASPALRTAVCERVEDMPLLNLYALFTRNT